ncbi:MAG: c-type cytochrome [Chloroflexi bacterium]|nr:c-type cytochrome [Chloroflexota bacterium]
MDLPKKDQLPEPIAPHGLPGTRPSILPFRIPSWPLWVWFIIAVAAIPFVSLPLMGVARYTTTSPQYCVTCHGTGETPDRAVKSLVHADFNQVTCVDCHAKPGQVVFEGYNKGFMAEPERVTNNCIRCHSDMPTRNDQTGFKYNFLDIKIPHQFHLDKGATCVTCHSNVAHDLNTPPTNRPRMESCNTCPAATDACNKCHTKSVPSSPSAVPAPPAPGSPADGRVLYMRVCAACHGQKGDRVQQADLSSEDFLNTQGDAKLFKVTAEGQGVMPPLSREHGGALSDDEIRATLGYLKILALGTAASKIDAKALYDRNCIVCHGADGDKVAGVKHSSKEFWYSQGEETITKAISNGKGGMPPFAKGRGGTLSPEEIAAIAQYLRTFPGPGVVAGAGGQQLPGKDVYAKNCAACHGDKGDRVGSANFSSKEFISGQTDQDLMRVTAEGKGGMPGLGAAKGGPLSDDQVKQVVAYLKTLSGGQ